jgi:hypothetical protein
MPKMPTTEIQTGGLESDGGAISKATPTFTIMLDLDMALPALKSRSFLCLFRHYFYFRFGSPPFCVPDVGQRRAMPTVTHLSWARSKMWE